HVPIFLEELASFRTTQRSLIQLLQIQRQEPFTTHLEVETYTWDVLPERYRSVSVHEAIARELQWVVQELAWRGLAPRRLFFCIPSLMNLSLFLRLGRVSNLPTVCSNVLAGAILSGVSPSLNSVALLCLTFSAFYVGGMFLNDAFDAEYDQEHRPERPIPRGEIDRTVVYTMGGALLVLGIMLVMGHGILF